MEQEKNNISMELRLFNTFQNTKHASTETIMYFKEWEIITQDSIFVTQQIC